MNQKGYDLDKRQTVTTSQGQFKQITQFLSYNILGEIHSKKHLEAFIVHFKSRKIKRKENTLFMLSHDITKTKTEILTDNSAGRKHY